MGWIDIEFLAAYQNILRIGGFKYGYTPRTKDQHGFVEQLKQRFEGKVFHDVKPCHPPETLIGDAAEIGEEVALDDIQAGLDTFLHQYVVLIYPSGLKTLFLQ